MYLVCFELTTIVPVPIDCSYWISASVGYMNSFCMCVGNGKESVPNNTEVGNYYSKCTFIVTLIKQKHLVFILVILCFYTIVYGYPGNHRFPISGIRFPK